MAKKPKPKPESRRATVEAMRREQKSAERRKTFLVVGIAAVLGLGLVAAAAYPAVQRALNDTSGMALASYGVPAGEAGCEDIISEDAEGVGVHEPEGTTVTYATAPPATGPHWDVPAPFSRKFYTPQDVPPVERMVHNLEHGYSMVWYDDSVEGEQLTVLEDLAESAVEEQVTGGKFIVAPWDSARGEFPEGKSFALTHWTRDDGGKRQYCEQISGEVVSDFIQEFPYTDSPEPNAI